MGEIMRGRTDTGAILAGDPVQAGRVIERAGELLDALRDCGEAAAELIPDTTDADRPRGVLKGQAALCGELRELLDLAAAHLADLANRQQVIRDAQRALRDAGASQGRAAA
ncbi:MAG: hypothetical protein KDG57_22440 [Rhodoferax sp.]|nr:hypothetical protein [Rhodoferax sp.]